MVTDYWPTEEGYIFEGCMVLPCKAAGTISEMHVVYPSATAVGVITVNHHDTTFGIGCGVALRAANTDDMIPVAFNGVVKLTCHTTIELGEAICAGTTSGHILNNRTWDGAADTVNLLGWALQKCLTSGDEILVMLTGIGGRDA